MADVTTEILLRDSYIGQVATNCVLPGSFTSTNKQVMTRNPHRARDRIKRLKLVFPNFYMTVPDPVTETAPGGAATITASIEFNGNFYQAMFSGSASGTIADGSMLVSDWITVDIPRGAMFYDRSYYTNAAGIIYAQQRFSGGYHTLCNAGASGIVDKTMGGTISNTNTGVAYLPVAIIAETRAASVLLIGDSIVMGVNDTADATDEVGILARSIARGAAVINAGSSGDRAYRYLTNGTLRQSLGQYCSHIACNLGVNDIMSGGRTSAQLQADMASIAALFPGKPFFAATITPKTTSTDSWATTANQTVTAQESVRTNYNGALRSGLVPCTDVLDVCAPIEVNASGVLTQDGGRWPAAGTTDGLHPVSATYKMVRDSSAIPSGYFM